MRNQNVWHENKPARMTPRLLPNLPQELLEVCLGSDWSRVFGPWELYWVKSQFSSQKRSQDSSGDEAAFLWKASQELQLICSGRGSLSGVRHFITHAVFSDAAPHPRPPRPSHSPLKWIANCYSFYFTAENMKAQSGPVGDWQSPFLRAPFPHGPSPGVGICTFLSPVYSAPRGDTVFTLSRPYLLPHSVAPTWRVYTAGQSYNL